jgi:hypothetical protein
MIEHTVSHVLIPHLYACSRRGRLSFSFKTQGCHSELPYDIAPRMILETFRPDLPKLPNVSHGTESPRKASRW